MRTNVTAVLVLMLGAWTQGSALQAEALPEADEVLARAIAYHDPGGAWEAGTFEFELDETRPDGNSRRTSLRLDNAEGSFRWKTERDGRKVDVVVSGEAVEATLDGTAEFTPEEGEKYRLTPERARWIRDYYVYLYGLPMKLRDPGTRIDDRVVREEYDGHDTYRLRVTYDESIGSDVWYFYFATESSRLVGYRFHHDETTDDGEYILLEGEAKVGQLRLPANRRWYTHDGDRFLGTDTIRDR